MVLSPARRSRLSWFVVVGTAALVMGLGSFGVAAAAPTLAVGAPAASSLLPLAQPFLNTVAVGAPLHPSHGGGGGGGSSCTTTLPAPNGVAYTPSELQKAYSFNTADTGRGETIAIIDAYGSPSLSSDLACFDSTFGLSAPTLKIVTPFGSVHGKNTGWGLETSLDVEWAHAMAPSATILLIVTPSSSLTYLINDAVPYAVSHGAKVISMSWGAAESTLGCATESTESVYFANAVSAGAILVGASGDSGANDGTSAPTVDYPAADPNVVGAGGTTLTTTPTGTWGGEVVWNDASGATGGGVSACFGEPGYQSVHKILVTTAGSVSTTPAGRAVPDVSYDASPYTGVWVYDTSGYSGWVQVGGTSAAAPQGSAIFADALSTGVTDLNGGSVHGLLYDLIGSGNVHDITSGNNGYYYASSGYDACTGIGSPVESGVISAL